MPKWSAPTAYNIGIRATTTALARSQPIETRRAPSRSMTGPPRILRMTRGAVSTSATSPVLVGLPVVVSANQGNASIDSLVPVSETASAASQP